MKLCILLCLLTLAVSENLDKLEHKGKKTPLLWYILERLTSLSTNVNEIKNKQAQIGTELANWKTIVDNQFSSLKKQSKCKILSLNGVKNTLTTNLGTELANRKKIMANRKTIVDNQFSSLKKQSKCQSGVDGQHIANPTWPYIKKIRFNPPFSATPSFVYGFSTLDFSHQRNIRTHAEITDFTRTGVSILLKKWADTLMYGLRISWMACPK